MSYHTKVELIYVDIDTIEPRDVHADLVNDLVELLADGEATLNVYSFDVIGLVSTISALSPSVPFAVRGWGEAPRDVWLREYSEGQEVFALGPPDDAI